MDLNYISGEYMVGTKCFSIVDEGRPELLGNQSGDRKIAVRLYYPVQKKDVENRARAVIFSERKKAAIQKAFHIHSISDELNLAHYYEDVPIADDRTFPLIMFSMGYNSYVESNTCLLCELASRGYVVASVGHAYEAVENDYEDGSYDLYDKTINKKMYTSVIGALWKQRKMMKAKCDEKEALDNFEQFQNKYTPYIKDRVKEWAADILRATDEVKRRYSDYLDLSRGIGASGHSLGGCLAYYLCRYRDEFTCGINIDGGLFGEYPESTMTKPFCQISCEDNINVETRTLINTNADTYHVIFEDMKHIGFTDAKFYIPMKSLVGKLDSEEMYRNLAYCHITFFNKYLKGEDVSLEGMESTKIHYVKVV